MITLILLGVVILAIVYAISVYNRLVRYRALVREAFSGITVQLRRRADLVPNLVEAMFTGFPGNSGETLHITVAPEDAVSTILPPCPVSIRCFPASFERRKTLERFTSMTVAQSSSEYAVAGARRIVPALFTRMVTGPNF